MFICCCMQLGLYGVARYLRRDCGVTDKLIRKLCNICRVSNIFIEFKAKKGKQSESQKEFEAKFSNLQNASYNLAYSVEDGINILIKNKIILE